MKFNTAEKNKSSSNHSRIKNNNFISQTVWELKSKRYQNTRPTLPRLYSDSLNRHGSISLEQKGFLKDFENAQDFMSAEERSKIQASIKKIPVLFINTEFFLGTVSGPNYDESTRFYQDFAAARSVSTYPILQGMGRAGEPICDYYYIRVFESATVLGLADGCNWGEPPKIAAKRAATAFVLYLQNRLNLLTDTHQLCTLILNGFSAAHASIIEGHRDIYAAGSTTLLGGVLVPVCTTSASGLNSSSAPLSAPLSTPLPSQETSPIPIPIAVPKLNMAKFKAKTNFRKESPRSLGTLPSSAPHPKASRLVALSNLDSKKPSEEEAPLNVPTVPLKKKQSNVDTSIDGNFLNFDFIKDMKELSLNDPLLLSNGDTLHPGISGGNSANSESGISTSSSSLDDVSGGSHASDLPTTRKLNLKKERKNKKWAFVFGNVGDCKLFVYSQRKDEVTDITHSNRSDSVDPSDCGGRLGPYKGGKPDLRNLTVMSHIVEKNDIIIAVTDGVHDNLDPELLGRSPTEFEQSADNWTSLDHNVAKTIKKTFREKLLKDIIHSGPITPIEICNSLTKYCTSITEPSRTFMEQNPSSELPENYELYPGKMDHTSVICVKVGTIPAASEQLIRDAISKKRFSRAVTSPDNLA